MQPAQNACCAGCLLHDISNYRSKSYFRVKFCAGMLAYQQRLKTLANKTLFWLSTQVVSVSHQKIFDIKIVRIKFIFTRVFF